MRRSLACGVVVGLVLLTGCRAADDSGPPAAERGPGDTTAAMVATAPRLIGTPPYVRLELPERFTRALAADAAYANMTPADLGPAAAPRTDGWSYPWSADQAAFALLGDFDGDGARDAAILQRSTQGGRAVAVLDTKPAPTVHVLHAWSNGAVGETGPTAFYLVGYPAGRHAIPDFGGARGGADSVVVLPHEGITVAYFGKAATTHFYKDGRFERMFTAD